MGGKALNFKQVLFVFLEMYHRVCLYDRMTFTRFSRGPENNEKTRQNSENKPTFNINGKIEIEEKLVKT